MYTTTLAGRNFDIVDFSIKYGWTTNIDNSFVHHSHDKTQFILNNLYILY